MGEDGSVTIQCLVDTSKFDEQMSKIERRIDQAEKNKQLKFGASQRAVRELENYRQKIFEVEQEFEKLSREKEKNDAILSKQSAGVNLTPAEFTQIENAEQIARSYEKTGAELDKMYLKQDALTANVQKTANAYEVADIKVKDLKRDLDKVNTKKAQSGIENFNKGLESVGKSIKSQIRNVGRWALAIFGIRGAITALRQASSIIGQYDEQYATNLEYIRYALAMSLKPVLEYIVSLLAQALQYVNYIASAWFGITGGIFKSANAFKSAKSSLGGMAKSAKEIEKSISGFDEINKLQDNSSAGGTGANTGGIVAPSIDLSGMQGEIPSWIKWIADNKDIILAVLGGVLAGITAIKLGLGGIKALGIGLMITGIIYAIQNVIKYLKDPSWQNFGKIITGIGVAILGLGVIIGSLPVAVAGAIVIIVGLIVANWKKIKGWLDTASNWIEGLGDRIVNSVNSKMNWIGENFGIVGKLLVGIFNGVVVFLTTLLGELIQNFKTSWDSIFTGFKQIFDGIIKILKGDFAGGFKLVAQGIFNVFSGMWHNIYGVFISIWNAIVKTFNKGGDIFQGITSGVSATFKTVANLVISGINKVIRVPFDKINGLLNKLKDISIAGVKPFNGLFGYNPIAVPQIPKLASGGIINYPNRGVGLGGMAIGGEAGREGVIPLTDSQAMETLGEAIGRYITINATVNNTMDGRLISRHMQRIQAQRAFSSNL